MQRYLNKYTAIFTLTILVVLFTLPNVTKAGSISLPPNNLGLVGYWSMEDGAGTTATDFSGNGNTGTLTNMDDTDWVDGKFGKALSFDGVDDEISASDSLLPMGNSARSVSVWIKTTVTGEKYFVRWGVNSPNTAFAVGLRDGAVIATQYGGGKTSSVVLNDDRWHHVVFVWDETTAYIYTDGVSQSVGTEGSWSVNTSPEKLNIGKLGDDWASSYAFTGSIDDVRIYNRALSATEVGTLYSRSKHTKIQSGVSNEGLLAYWSFEDATSSKATDFSGNGNTANITGANWTDNGKKGGALDFVAYNYATSTDPGIPDGSNFTVSLWAYPTGLNPNTNFGNRTINQEWPALGSWALYFWEGNSIHFSAKNTAGDFLDSSVITSLSTNRWYFLTATVDNSNIRLYVDGALVATTPYTGTLFSSTADIIIPSSSSDPFAGKLDEIRIYDRALSATEISTLYGSTKSTKINTSQNNKITDGLVGLWSFNGQDISGTTAYDRSGQGNNGTLTNGPTPVAGKIGQGMEFDGNNDYLRIPDTSALYFGSNDFTVSFWVLKDTTSASTFGQIYFIGPNSNNGWGIYMDGSKQYLEISTTGSNETVSYASTPITAMNTGQWYHFDFVRNGGYLYTYRDTVLINSTNIGAITVYNSTKPIDFGVTSDSNATPTGYYHDGKLDDIRIYNRALSTKEIQQLYGQGR